MDLTALDVFGTTEPPPERRHLRAGTLSAILEVGQLRYIRWHGVEVLRGIAFLVRDDAWGTLAASLSDLTVTEGPDGFAVTHAARVASGDGRLTILARIEARTGGSLAFEATFTAATEFLTNRTGFVVLHPDHAAGSPLRIGHGDGTVEATAFPGPISPDQPAFDILSLSHEPAPGVTAEIAFEGDVFEMEDQRNWSDASFKTYVRPLDWPRPYVIPAGTTERQAVILSLSGTPDAIVASAKPRSGGETVPPMALRLAEGEAVPHALPLPGLAHGLILRIRDAPDATRLAAAAALARREGLWLAVEAILPHRDPEVEAAALLAAIAGQPVEALLVTAARDLRTRPSGHVPADEAPLADSVAALRRGGFRGQIGAGTPAFFTEFNRNPPPLADFAFFGASAIVHAADDRSVAETVRVLPAIMDSAAGLCPGVGLWPGPLAIAPTVNPYGPGLATTDGTTRTCLAARDPRHGALFGAAHLVAALAGTIGGAEVLAPLHASGPIGLVAPDGSPWPLAFVHAAVAGGRGAALREAPGGEGTASIAWDSGDRWTVLLANLSEDPVEVACPPGLGSVERLGPGASGWISETAGGPTIRLDPYATLRLTGAA